MAGEPAIWRICYWIVVIFTLVLGGLHSFTGANLRIQNVQMGELLVVDVPRVTQRPEFGRLAVCVRQGDRHPG